MLFHGESNEYHVVASHPLLYIVSVLYLPNNSDMMVQWCRPKMVHSLEISILLVKLARYACRMYGTELHIQSAV